MTRSGWRKLLVGVGFVAGWQMICSLRLVNPILLASPMDIWLAFANSGGEYLMAFQTTLFEMTVAISVAWIAGVSVGTAVGMMPIFGRAVAPIFSALFAIPLIIWYPYFIILLGIGSESKMAYAAVSGFFPIALNTLSGVQLVDRRFIMLARSIGASSLQIFFKFILMFSLPAIVSGLRTGTSLAVIGVLVTEMLASTKGLGYLIAYHRTLFDTGHVYLGILLALTCTLPINMALSRIERRVDRWRDLRYASAR